ncbi:hypothetical protein ColTof4_12404 [Colletotrichum tofieldiae]|uniref:Celp0028 effector like protein n=1 Tax=Colletotrichum tofieldiae TaxID=708197 RepID=A0A166VUH1_9PEZI|nr:hypothetical protein CT0861_00082 [Colletotrichum tofieldiae]GKT59305.1 hypothetical protein ColTof3_06644 [Colletotrichum tofieldiae]GKT79981.1 hypothetical protein ColTof4_12404 [Colletotrichum tofieldiae]GKT85464.1 hypothetical protein Ct61P_03314 [Colletotrichum tofieldiae]
MKSLQLLGLFLVAVTNAVPITDSELIARGGPAGALADGEMLLVNGDQLEIVNETSFHEILKAEGIALEKPEIDYEFLNFTAPADIDTKLMDRSCAYTTSYVIDKTQRFLDWDVQMGPVVRGAGEGITAYIATGWSVSNTVQVSAGLDFKVIKDYLGGEFGINYSRTWTTTTTDQYSTVVKNGMAGVWITQPWTNRKYGRTFRGCVGSMTQTGTFLADSHEDGSYANSKWVSGFITACVKTAPASGKDMTRCHGSGNFI